MKKKFTATVKLHMDRQSEVKTFSDQYAATRWAIRRMHALGAKSMIWHVTGPRGGCVANPFSYRLNPPQD